MEAGRGRIFLGKLSVPVQEAMVGAVVGFAASFAGLLSFSKTDQYNLEMAMEEAVANAVKHYSAPVEDGALIHVEFYVEDGAFTVSVRERGAPYDKVHAESYSPGSLEKMELPGLGQLLMNKAMDDVQFINMGREGKETRLVKKIAQEQIPPALCPAQNAKRSSARPTVTDPVVRASVAADAPQISRLAWRCYGYTQMEILYSPETLSAEMEAHHLSSWVGVDPASGALIGHLGLRYDEQHPGVPEVGLAFVDPGYRSPRLMQKIAAKLLHFAQEEKNLGVFSKSATTHIFSQKSMMEYLDAQTCGLLLALAPVGMQARDLPTHVQEKGSVAIQYRSFDRSKATVYPPVRHSAVLEQLYGLLGLPREFANASTSYAGSVSRFRVETAPAEMNVVFLVVDSIGETTAAELSAAFAQSRKQRRDAVYLHLPCSDPNLSLLADQCEHMGFFFSGIMPQANKGADIFLMQWLNVELDFDKIAIYGDNACVLFDYICSERQRIGG